MYKIYIHKVINIYKKLSNKTVRSHYKTENINVNYQGDI